MKLFSSIALAVSLMVTQVHAQAEEVPPSDASVQELLQTMHAADLIGNAQQQFDSMFQSMTQQVTQGKPATPEQQKALDNFHGKMKEILHKELGWESMQPIIVQIYQKSLNQDEVNGMIAFYKTPTGQAVIKKMPLIMQNTMSLMQQKMPHMVQEIQQAAKESFKDLKPAK